jgi:adenine/guanine phosphoribosyltransferase-like PRPP-binding protein
MPWTGEWVADRLDAKLEVAGSGADFGLRGGLTPQHLLGMALRLNPKRAQLLVSTVLGKHVPTDPRVVYGAGRLLGALVADALTGLDSGIRPDAERALIEALDGSGAAADELLRRCTCHRDRLAPWADPPVVLGYAETATGLGHAVADSLGASYLHSTRRTVVGMDPVSGFEEEHSHATGHLLLPADRGLLAGAAPLVLVDDELSTGRTILNTIAALDRTSPRRTYVLASLVDLRSDEDRERMSAWAERTGLTIIVVALVDARLELPPTVLERGAELVASYGAPRPGSVPDPAAAPGREVHEVRCWPPGVAEGGRHGFDSEDSLAIAFAAQTCAAEVATAIRKDPSAHGGVRRVLVLGTEELMYAPLRIALALQELLTTQTNSGEPAVTVRYSTTTRSPVLAVDEPTYAIRTRLEFPAHDSPDDELGPRYAYNVLAGADRSRRFSDIVLVVDDMSDSKTLCSAGGLVPLLQDAADQVHLVWIPALLPVGVPLHGPRFGSYAADEVLWLLKDLSEVDLEAPTEEREEAIQTRGAHYASSLPIEYQPSAEYQQLYRNALRRSSVQVAHAVGVVAELVLAERGPSAVLVSLARAGTPVGILIRRWVADMHGIELPHYAASIVRGRGIDMMALRYLAARHDPTSIVFIDGWTGKGAIARELAVAVHRANTALRLSADAGFSSELAVLADTGACVRLFGTREDYLIPSACLNSTVSGLVSRTVLNDSHIGAADFHGAKFYRHLEDADLSNGFLAAISARFTEVRQGVAQTIADRAAGRVATEPTWQGWEMVAELGRRYGIDQVNLIKPGVGETTRVLLRRMPWKVLMRRDRVDELEHVIVLARQRGVSVEFVDDLTYSCVGLIHPGYTQASGSSSNTAPPWGSEIAEPAT